MNIYQNILQAQKEGKKLLAVLIDPEKIDVKTIAPFFEKVHESITTHIFVGGGIRTKKQLEIAFNAGEDLVVIGTAFENDESFFNDLKK